MKRQMLVFLMVFMCLMIVPVQAQEDELESAFGEVVRISTDQIILKEYDYDADMDKEISYVINSETKFKNVESKDDIQAGGLVEIFFWNEDGKRIAKIIEKDVYGEDETGLDSGEEEGFGLEEGSLEPAPEYADYDASPDE